MLQQINSLISKLNPSTRFLVLFIPLVVTWFISYHLIYGITFINVEHDILTSFSVILAKQANFILGLLGFETNIEVHGDMVVSKILKYKYQHGVWIGEPCNGIKIFGVFSIFILCLRSKWINKVLFIPFGIFILHLLNVIRVASLTYISAVNPNVLDFNHNITFQIIVYSAMLLLWLFFIKKFTNS